MSDVCGREGEEEQEEGNIPRLAAGRLSLLLRRSQRQPQVAIRPLYYDGPVLPGVTQAP
jgi:hypothetical protein